MSKRQVDTYDSEEVIDLLEFLQPLWRNKLAIICIAVVGAILAGLISLFLIPPEFESRLNIYVGIPETYTTRYGDYTLPIMTNDQYMDMIRHDIVLQKTIDDIKPAVVISRSALKNSISISSKQTGNNKTEFIITISHREPESSKLIAETLYQNYMKYVDVVIRSRALDYYHDVYTISMETAQLSLESEREKLKSDTELLDNTEKYLDVEGVLDKLPSTSATIVIDNLVNPDYLKLQNDILTRKQTISELENTIKRNKRYLNDIKVEKDIVSEFYTTGEIDRNKTTIINVVDRYIYRTNTVVEGEKVGQGLIKNIVVGGILGFLACSAGVIGRQILRRKQLAA
jgi:capsular polysaccharide biosynthesis protein